MTSLRMDVLRRVVLALAASALAVGVGGTPAAGEDEKGDGRATVSDVHDAARMFDPDVVRKARADLRRIERETKVATMIETVDQVDDESIKQAVLRKARRWGEPGFFVLIDKKDRKIDVVLNRGSGNGIALNPSTVRTIQDAIVSGFKQRDFNKGLERGVAAIEKAAFESLEKATPRNEDYTPTVAQAVAGARGDRPSVAALLQKNQVRLTLAGARVAVAGAEAHAAVKGWKVNIAVVDDGGHLLAFARMDGSRPASGSTAITKATSAATFRQETGPLPKGPGAPDLLLNLSLQNAAAAGGGKITSLPGGIPITHDGQVIGALGVGGGTGEQDAEVARAGVARLLQSLKPTAEAGEKARSDTDEKAEVPSLKPR